METLIQITDSTPVAILTVGQQKELFREWIKDIFGMSGSEISVPRDSTARESTPRYVYGIAGISTLFNVSYGTACKLKDGVLKPAIMQQGRKIICDADMAIKLFSQKSDIK